VEAWRAKLDEGDTAAAWDLFLERYRRLILATIRRMVGNQEDVFDAFAHVCHGLFARDMARLGRFSEEGPRTARFSTWLITVVHHQVVDWLRQENGRIRIKTPEGLSPLQRGIFTQVFVLKRSHLEAYENACAADGELTFGAFLRELSVAYRLVESAHPRGVMRYLAAPPPLEDASTPEWTLDVTNIRGRLSEAMGSLPREQRLAIQLYVVEGLPAADVARTLGWPSEKTVYNRVYRSLTKLRAALEHAGIGPTEV
jgi:RNA polymerase sigma factor (sigma-70 family)